MSECRNCRKSTDHKASNRRSFCDLNCFVEWNRKNHPKRKRETRSCIICSTSFECVPSSEKKCCSQSCATTHRNLHRKKSIYQKVSDGNKRAYQNGKLPGLLLGNPKGGKGKDRYGKKCIQFQKTCPICNQMFTVPKWKKQQVYCSVKCSSRSPNQGGYREGSVRHYKSGWYESSVAGRIWLDSSYEFIMAKYLDGKQYRWKRNKIGFPYVRSDGKSARYFPDFYIEDIDLWVETKGRKIPDDKLKIEAFPYRIIVIDNSNIKKPETWPF